MPLKKSATVSSLPGQRSLLPIQRYAEFSNCRNYRYSLRRVWRQEGAYVNFVLLNPSTADEVTDDPTIRRCLGFADAWGYDGLIVTNLFGVRETNPKKLNRHVNPVGIDNDDYLIRYASACALIVCAWGAYGNFWDRDRAVKTLLQAHGSKLHHLGLTKQGQPRHPLYLKGDLKPTLWI